MTIHPDRLLAVGRIVRAFGIRGEVVVQPLTDFPARLVKAPLLWMGSDPASVTGTGVERGAVHARSIRLKLKGVGSRDEAEALRGRFLFVDEEHRAPLRKGEYFVHDVVGLEVREESGAGLGAVADVLRYPAGDVYVVRGARGEILIPAVREFIRGVDMAARTMTVRLIEGMAE